MGSGRLLPNTPAAGGWQRPLSSSSFQLRGQQAPASDAGLVEHVNTPGRRTGWRSPGQAHLVDCLWKLQARPKSLRFKEAHCRPLQVGRPVYRRGPGSRPDLGAGMSDRVLPAGALPSHYHDGASPAAAGPGPGPGPRLVTGRRRRRRRPGRPRLAAGTEIPGRIRLAAGGRHLRSEVANSPGCSASAGLKPPAAGLPVGRKLRSSSLAGSASGGRPAGGRISICHTPSRAHRDCAIMMIT